MGYIVDRHFQFTHPWPEILPEAEETTLDLLAQRDTDLEHHLNTLVQFGLVSSGSPGGLDITSTTETTVRSATLARVPFKHRILTMVDMMLFANGTLAGVAGDVWQFRTKYDGTNALRRRYQNPLGSSWNQSISYVSVSPEIPAGTSTTVLVTAQRVAGTGGLKTFGDNTTNEIRYFVLPV